MFYSSLLPQARNPFAVRLCVYVCMYVYICIYIDIYIYIYVKRQTSAGLNLIGAERALPAAERALVPAVPHIWIN